jgi:hypothetical protein
MPANGLGSAFLHPVSSSTFLPGTMVWFELSELCAADGTTLVIERIKLTIR